MKTRTETVREGELLGPVNWDYDFLKHFDSYCCPDDEKKKMCEEKMDNLRKLEYNPDKFQATNDGGWPRCGWGDVIAVGMYDGWPYWYPVPSVCIAGIFGGEWHSFHNITSIRLKP